MAKACVYAPDKGALIFYKLKKQFGYNKAWDIYGIVMSSKFQNDFRDTLSLDAEGVPNFESIMKNNYIQKYIGDKSLMDMALKEFSPVEDTIDNYNQCLEQMKKFNLEHPNNNKFTAIVDYFDDKIGVKIVKKTEASDRIAKSQYTSLALNKRLANLLSPLGITVGMLNEIETEAGRVGVTDFSKARMIGDNTVSMIKIANNMEGANALSEEFSHLIIGALRDTPIVLRTINMLSTDEEALRSILGDEYEDTVLFQGEDMEFVAEEALGKLLRNKLNTLIETKSQTLVLRFINFIKNLFKRINIDNVQKAINEADGAMNTIAGNILSGKTKISTEMIQASQRDALFNALSDRIARNIEILNTAKKTELKRYRISDSQASKDIYKDRIGNLNTFTLEDADTVLGIMNYSLQALKDLRAASVALRDIHDKSPLDMFKILRGIRSTLLSYGPFIQRMNDAVMDENEEDDNMFLRKFTITINDITNEVDVPLVILELNNLTQQVGLKLMRVAKDKFSEFLKPFLGEEITIEMGKHKGEKVSVRQLLDSSEKDISFLDRWLDAMGDSSDILLLAFDAIVKKANDKARFNTIDDIRRILALRKKAESMGINSFDWMYERDREGKLTGNYISEINHTLFQRDYNDLMNRLNKKYGKNAKGVQADLKLKEKEAWIKTHAIEDIFGDLEPNPNIYRNNDYFALNLNQKNILNEFIEIKESFDKKLPSDRVASLKAIQIRKNGTQRLVDMASRPSEIWSNIQENLASSIFEREDDDAIFGDNSVKRGITDFSNREFMVLPVLYTNRLSKPDELSTDAFGTLIAYAAMSNRYEQMENIIDPLEVGRSIITDGGRLVKSTRGGNKLIEKFRALGETVTGDVYELSGTNIEKRLLDFFEANVYWRYLKDQGTFDVFGKKVNVNKLVSKMLGVSSVAQLGLNYLANLANVTTGAAMLNIEAVSGEFFTVKQLAKADFIYAKEIGPFLSELGSRDKTNTLSLIDEYFNIKGEFYKKMKESNLRKNLLLRIFGSSIAFLGQECGDHWLYNRSAIAMMLNEKVLYKGLEMNLFEAVEKSKVVENGIGRLVFDDIQSLNGDTYDIALFSRKMLHVNQSMFGVYNEEDANAANRVALGRLVMQYRKWMKAQYNKRFMAGQQSLALGQWEEGYYRTAFRVANDLARGKVKLPMVWNTLSNHEKANIKRALMEIALSTAIWVLAEIIEWPDDKDRPWAMKLAEYSTKRLNHELGLLTPGLPMIEETLKTVKSPAASLSLISDVTRLIGSTIDPRDWNNEILSGPYEGMSTLEKNLYKAPIPGLMQYRLVNKFIGELDSSIDYYTKSY